MRSPIAYRHTPFSDLKPLDRLFDEHISSGGSENTINLAESHYLENEGYLQHLGASFRQLISVIDPASLNLN